MSLLGEHGKLTGFSEQRSQSNCSQAENNNWEEGKENKIDGGKKKFKEWKQQVQLEQCGKKQNI